MPITDASAIILRFGAFELDLANRELRRAGVLLKLSPQQFQVLRLLAERAGELLTREEMQREIWGDGTFVDFDRNLNVCVAQIRSTLNDDSDSPRFIQTLPKRGYRFIAPVERIAPGSVPIAAVPPRRVDYRWLLVAAVAIACAAVIVHRMTPQPRIMIATLPFENLTGEPGEDLFTDGLTEELTGQFGSLNPDRLGAIGRSSVMRYKGAAHSINQIGRDLHVDYVVEGTVRKSAGRIRITSHMIKVADQSEIWTDTSERDESELFRMEEEVAARIAAAVTGKLLGGTPAATPARVRNQDAYRAYLNGRYLEHKGTIADIERGIAQFDEAVKLDPQFDQAYAAAADAYVSLGRAGGVASETFPHARTAAEKALSINEGDAEAHNALANVFFWYEWNWPLAERHFTRAIAINPSDPLAHHDFAFFLIAMGRTEQGLMSLRRALALDPLSPRVNIDAGWLLLQAHHFPEAINQAQRAQQLEPGLAEANACIIRGLFFQKKYRDVVDALHATGPDPEATLRRMYRERLKQPEDSFTAATRYAFLGEKEKALDALDQAYAARKAMMVLLKTDPGLTALHGERRFQELVRKMALP